MKVESKNKVFQNGRRLNQKELAVAYNLIISKGRKHYPYDMSRIEGDHCYCNGSGEFELLPITDPAVVEGGKRYMVCRKCGGSSHL